MMRESPYLKADRLGDVLAALQFFGTIAQRSVNCSDFCLAKPPRNGSLALWFSDCFLSGN